MLCLYLSKSQACIACGGKKRAASLLELEFQKVVSYRVGIESGPSARSASALTHETISPDSLKDAYNIMLRVTIKFKALTACLNHIRHFIVFTMPQ